MSRPNVPSRSRASSRSSWRTWPRVAVLALVGATAAGCSNSGRFDSNPYASNQAPPQQSEVTGSIAPRPARTGTVVSQPLPSPSRPATVAASGSGGYASGAQGLGAYRPFAQSADITGSVSRPAAPPKPAGHWTWDGGSPVTVGPGESVEIIARRHGVPASAVLSTNGITNPATVKPGQRLVIPRYVSTDAPQAQAPAPHVSAPQVAAPASGGNVHVVAPGESLIGIARKYGTSLTALAKANNIQPYAKVSIGDRIALPAGSRPVAQRPTSAPQIAQPRTAAPPVDRVASVPAQNARMATQEPPTTDTVAKETQAAGALPSFRWPVKGRIISAFGSKPNGVQNDGINLAVPEGTPVKAADDGVVAYSGNELKGYGNLVLIRHANGFVSAYANASELLVKRGDSVKRGQVIAKAGQTGNVTSPQLHFEIRKGSTPVDPTQYLGGA